MEEVRAKRFGKIVMLLVFANDVSAYFVNINLTCAFVNGQSPGRISGNNLAVIKALRFSGASHL